MVVSRKGLLAVTMGDPAGIGPEVCLKAVERFRSNRFVPVIFGDGDVLQQCAATCNLTSLPIASSLDDAARLAIEEVASIVHLPGLEPGWKPGEISAATGAASYQYVIRAIEAAMSGQVQGVVTGPINKEALHRAGIAFPGHTEIFATFTKADKACMMLTSRELTCSFVTTHIGLCDVPKNISLERVFDVIVLTRDAIQKMRDREPQLVICGLNPHAGEHGLFGNREEERFIIPAVEKARLLGVQIEGPLPPDTAFLPARRQNTDAFICMYHDQGHIPLKALSFDTAVNTTLGLPIVRTSVDHGTAVDIAWRGIADPTSMLEALALAEKLN